MAKYSSGKAEKSPGDRSSSSSGSGAFDPKRLALGEDEIRELVVSATGRIGVGKFVELMVLILDSLKRNDARTVEQITRQNRSHSLQTLLKAVTAALADGRWPAARNTIYQAARCAYENSLEHRWALADYLDSFREKQVSDKPARRLHTHRPRSNRSDSK